MAEEQRLAFVEQRDGVQGAVAFARQGIKIYRSCVLQSARRGYGVKGSAYADKSPHHASFREYRRGFIDSYLAFKAYVELHRTENETMPR